MEEQVSTKDHNRNETLGAEVGLDVYGIMALFVLRSRLIAITTISLTAAGIAFALLSAPQYHSEATIAPKQAQSAGGGLLSQLGGVGGYLASQMGNNANLARLETIIKSDEMAKAVMAESTFLPKVFPDKWDTVSQKWKKGGIPPTGDEIAETIHGGILEVSTNLEKNMLTLGINFGDPKTAKDLADAFLRTLNARIRMDIKAESDSNRHYLENEMVTIFDPMVRGKIQNLIASEIEKGMIMSSNAFDVLTHPQLPSEKSAPNRKMITILAFLVGIFVSTALVLLGSFGKFFLKKLRTSLLNVSRLGPASIFLINREIDKKG